MKSLRPTSDELAALSRELNRRMIKGCKIILCILIPAFLLTVALIVIPQPEQPQSKPGKIDTVLRDTSHLTKGERIRLYFDTGYEVKKLGNVYYLKQKSK